MNVNPNKFDVRVIQKFQTQLNITEKDVESELKHLSKEDDAQLITVTGTYLENVETQTLPTGASIKPVRPA